LTLKGFDFLAGRLLARGLAVGSRYSGNLAGGSAQALSLDSEENVDRISGLPKRACDLLYPSTKVLIDGLHEQML
jgi:hypothetical protein